MYIWDGREYRLVPVTKTTACGTVIQEVGMVPKFIHEIIARQDSPFFVELWDNVSRRLAAQADHAVPFNGLGIATVENAENVTPVVNGFKTK